MTLRLQVGVNPVDRQVFHTIFIIYCDKLTKTVPRERGKKINDSGVPVSAAPD